MEINDWKEIRCWWCAVISLSHKFSNTLYCAIICKGENCVNTRPIPSFSFDRMRQTHAIIALHGVSLPIRRESVHRVTVVEFLHTR